MSYKIPGAWAASRSVIRPVPSARVRAGGFLGRRIDANLDSLLLGLESPIPRAFEQLARGETPAIRTGGRLSDLYKWIEGAAYTLAQTRHDGLERELARVVDVVVKANAVIARERRPEYTELYVAGHFFQAAVADFRSTGRRLLLDAACNWADDLIELHKAKHPCFASLHENAHPCVELGLILLSRETGRTQYLEFAGALIDAYRIADTVAELECGRHLRHAVCVEYLLTACAELYFETGQSEGLERLYRLWDELVTTRLYITGGIGYDEIIPATPFDLPQTLEHNRRKDVAETCASVGMMLFSGRIHAAFGESRCFDTIETILYNNFLGALDLENRGIYYYNPLRYVGHPPGKTDMDREFSRRTVLPDVHPTSCCITNAWRFFPRLGEYLFSADERGLYVNLYTTSAVRHLSPDGTPFSLTIETEYPHDPQVTARIDTQRPTSFALRFRVPGWCTQASMSLPDGSSQAIEGGRYVSVEQNWNPGDTLTLRFEMPVRMLNSRPEITANAGCVAFTRGPLVYCLEQEDCDVDIRRVAIPFTSADASRLVRAEWQPGLLGGIHVLKMPGLARPEPPGPDAPYYESDAEWTPVELTLIPFYARANRRGPSRWITLIPQCPGTGGQASRT